VEFLSVILHKNIDVDSDYNTTLSRFHNQQSLILQIEYHITEYDNWELSWEPELRPFEDAVGLLTDKNLIDYQTYKWMKNGTEKDRINYPSSFSGKLRKKLLDGMDSVILIYVNELAYQNQEKQIVLYTADFPLWRILMQVKRHFNWFAKNTSSIFAPFDKVRCRRRGCRKDNDSSILCNDQMICCNTRNGKHQILL